MSTQGSDLSLQDCDISSSTGSGVGIEGGGPLLTRCNVHNCERHGFAIFSELGGSAGAVCLAWQGIVNSVGLRAICTVNPCRFYH